MKNILITVVTISLFAACGSSIKTASDFDRSANFLGYKTYNFTPVSDSIPLVQLNKKRLFNAVSEQMNEHGYNWSADPDVYVNLHLILKGTEKSKFTTNYYGQGQSYSIGPGFSTTYMDLSPYSEYTLFVDLIDAKKKQLVWQGRVVGEIDNKDKDFEKYADKLMNKLFKKYPKIRYR